jgi:DNA-binding NtrC family response regulator
MARILSISYDETLLRTRELMLEWAGHQVTSALGFQDALAGCTTSDFDLAIIGHSIPGNDKKKLIEGFRRHNPKGVVIALTRAGEPRLAEVDHYISPGDPEDLLRTLSWIINPASERRAKLSRIK